MGPYIVALAAFGVLILLTAWLPMVLKEAPPVPAYALRWDRRSAIRAEDRVRRH